MNHWTLLNELAKQSRVELRKAFIKYNVTVTYNFETSCSKNRNSWMASKILNLLLKSLLQRNIIGIHPSKKVDFSVRQCKVYKAIQGPCQAAIFGIADHFQTIIIESPNSLRELVREGPVASHKQNKILICLFKNTTQCLFNLIRLISRIN